MTDDELDAVREERAVHVILAIVIALIVAGILLGRAELRSRSPNATQLLAILSPPVAR